MTAFASSQHMFARMQMPRRNTKDWLRDVADYLGVSPSELARRSGVSPSTLTRYLNDPTGDTGISQRTLDAVSAFSGVPLHQSPTPKREAGFAEPDASMLNMDDPDLPAWVRQAVEQARAGVNGRDPWRMRGTALDMSGVMPGDILIIDMNRRPSAGDIVCAQIYDWSASRAETIFRRFDPPFLMTHSSSGPPARPVVVDDDTIAIRGVAVGLIRPFVN